MMKMNVGEFARTVGVSVRTLHYYDEIGLLKPDSIDELSGYRFYGEREMKRMQEILFYRELDFSLKDIQRIISSPSYNKEDALKAQKHMLCLKRERLDKIIEMLESAEKGETNMDFKAFNTEKLDSYREEAKERWGKTQAYKEHSEKVEGYSASKWNEIAQGINAIMSEFSEIKKSGECADSEAAVSAVNKLQAFITETQYICTDEILEFLGQMYVSDERFKKNIDKYGEGTAEFINEAIKEYCNRIKSGTTQK